MTERLDARYLSEGDYGAWDELVRASPDGSIYSTTGYLGALCEALILAGQESDAQGLVNEYYFEKYRRFPAFRKEVQAVFQTSDIVRSKMLS